MAIKKMTIIRKLFVTGAIATALAVCPLGASAEVHYLAEAASDYMGISIDGNYTDWADKPMTKIQYPWDTGNNYHLGSLFRDETYVYLYINMSDRSYTQFNGYNYEFTVDGVVHSVVVVPPDGVNINPGTTPLIVRNQNGYTIINGANGFITRGDGKGDTWELKVPLSFFTPNTENIRSISFYCTNIGPQHLTASGTDTGAFVLAGTGLVIAAGSIFVKRKGVKHKKESVKQ